MDVHAVWKRMIDESSVCELMVSSLPFCLLGDADMLFNRFLQPWALIIITHPIQVLMRWGGWVAFSCELWQSGLFEILISEGSWHFLTLLLYVKAARNFSFMMDMCVFFFWKKWVTVQGHYQESGHVLKWPIVSSWRNKSPKIKVSMHSEKHSFYKAPHSVWKDVAPVFFSQGGSQNRNPGNRLTFWRDYTIHVSPFLECKQMRALWLAQFTELYPCRQEMKIFPPLWGCQVQKSFHWNSIWHSRYFYLYFTLPSLFTSFLL